MAVRLLSVSEYARHRGCDEKAVRKAILAERITVVMQGDRKMIDPEVADIQWAKNTRARADSRRPGADQSPAKGLGAANASEASGGAELDSGPKVPGYEQSRARREAAEAATAELNLAKALGLVIERDRAVTAVFTAFRSLRDGGMVLGRKLSAQAANLSDAREVQLLIEGAQRELFDTFARRTLPSLVQALGGVMPDAAVDQVETLPASVEVTA
jgi:hypothetical protein